MFKKTIYKNQEIEWGRVNFITGLNGVGKSYFLMNELPILFKNSKTFLKKSDDKRLASFINNNFEDVLVGLGKKNKIMKDEFKNRQFHIKDVVNMIDRDKEIILQNSESHNSDRFNAFPFQISSDLKTINIVEIISKEIDSLYTNLELRMIKFYNEMMNEISKEIINNSGFYENKKYEEFRYIKMKKSIDKFLNGKVVEGVDETGNQILIRDIGGKSITLNNLSDGEKKIFSLASYLLENKENLQPNVYIWDEPENSLNPSWQRMIIPFVSELLHEDSMLFVVSHSMDVLISSIQKDWKIFKLNRNKEGSKLDKTNIFDDKDLYKEFFSGFELIKKDIDGKKKFVIVEGETDKKYLESILNENKENEDIKVLNAGSSSKIIKLRNALECYNNLPKIISLFDNDVQGDITNSKNNENIKNKTLIYKNLEKGEAVEKLFINKIEVKEFDFDNNKYKLIKSNQDDLINNNIKLTTNRGNQQTIINKRFKNIGFLDSEIMSLKTKGYKLPSKNILADYLIQHQKDIIKSSLKDTIDEILDFFK